MKTEEQHECLVDIETVESILSSLARFGCAPACVPSHGFKCCARFSVCCDPEAGEEPEK
jgi:hypothetical protein